MMNRGLLAAYRVVVRAHAAVSGRKCQREAEIVRAEKALAALKPPAVTPRLQRKGAWRWSW